MKEGIIHTSIKQNPLLKQVNSADALKSLSTFYPSELLTHIY